MASTATRAVESSLDEAGECGFDACGDDGDDAGDDVLVAEGGEDSAGPAPTVAELVEMTGREREPAPMRPARASPSPGPEKERPAGDVLERAGVPTNVLAATIQPDPEQPGIGNIVPHRPEERADRRRLGAAMLGVGGVLHRMLDGTAMGELDVEAGRGLAFALASDAGTVEAQVMAQFAAAAVVLQGRMMGAAAKATQDRSVGSARATYDYVRASETGFRLVQRTLEAVDLARHRRRDRASVPAFVVGRVDLDPKPDRNGR